MNSLDVSRKLVIGRQSLLDLEEKILKLQSDINKHFEETKSRKG